MHLPPPPLWCGWVPSIEHKIHLRSLSAPIFGNLKTSLLKTLENYITRKALPFNLATYVLLSSILTSLLLWYYLVLMSIF